MKLSIIIPVYNAKGTLMRCVDSIVLQPVDKMEIILVDDGSTDGSSALCDNIKRQYEDENCEIKVIHKENGGLSSARNAGIEASTGELITFVDSDDFLGRNTYSKQMEFFECAEDVDVVEFPVAKFYNEFLKKENIEFTVDFYENPIDYLYETEAFHHAYAWNKIYRRCIFSPTPTLQSPTPTLPERGGRVKYDSTTDNTLSNTNLNLSPRSGGDGGGLFFADGKTFEDLLALPLWLSRARRIVTSDGGFYFYTFNPDGICETAGARQYADHLEALIKLMQWIPEDKRNNPKYAKLFVQALNVRKDLLKAKNLSNQSPALDLPEMEGRVGEEQIPSDLTPSFSTLLGCTWKEQVKLLMYKLGIVQ